VLHPKASLAFASTFGVMSIVLDVPLTEMLFVKDVDG
jgi:hypothetical protein